MIKKSILIFFLFFPVFVSFAGNIHIELLKDCSIPLEPGEHCTFAFKVSNSGTNPATLTPEFIIPSGWTCICPDTVFTLNPGEISLRLMTVIIPLRNPVGTYTITYELHSPKTGESAQLSRELKVKEKAGIQVKLLDAPVYVLAGESIHSLFLVKNLSNSPKKVTLISKNGKINGDTLITLPADASQNILVTTPTSHDIPVTRNEIIFIESRLENFNSYEPNTSSFANAFVKIIPLKEKENDRFYRIPVTAKIVALGKQEGSGTIQSGWQGEVYGHGNLAPNSSQYIEFRLRGPDQFQISPLGLTEEYFINYGNSNLYAFAGDKTYTLSPLTEQSRYGRGAEFNFSKGNTQWGAFYTHARYTATLKDEQAVYGMYTWKKDNYFKTSYLRKNISSEMDPANVFSVQGGYTLFKGSKVNAELAYGLRDKNSGSSYRMAYQGEYSRVNIYSQYIYADARFQGFYTNTRIANISSQVQLNKRFSVSFSYNHDDQNAALDTLYGTAPASDNLTAGFLFHYGNGNYLMINAGNSERKDRMQLNSFHYKESTVRTQFYHNTGKFIFQLQEETGKTTNVKENVSGSILTSNISLTYNPRPSFSLTAFTGQISSLRYSDSRINQWIYGGNINVSVHRKLKVYARYQNNFSPEDYYLDRNMLDMNLAYLITKNQEISFTARKTLIRKSRDNEDLAFSAVYLLNLMAPVKKSGPVSKVTGTLHTSGNTKVDGIILHLNGHTAVTDKEGNFTFVNVKTSTYNMIIDKASMNVGEIIDHKMPYTITVVPDAENRIDLNVVQSCVISAKLTYLVPEGQYDKHFDLPAFSSGAVLLEITNGEEVFRKLTDNTGTVRFDNLRPGTWKIKIFPASLTEEQVLNQKEITVLLKAGEEQRVNIGVKIKDKNIQFQQEDIKIQYR